MCFFLYKMLTRPIALVYIIASVLITQTHTLSIVNNATVPSDILTSVFLTQLQNNPNFFNNISVPNEGNYNSEKCISALQAISDKLPAMEVLPFIDSWGKFPSGILLGNLRDIGNFDQCIQISTDLSGDIGVVNGQYCSAIISLKQSTNSLVAASPFGASNNGLIPMDMLKLTLGICSPDTCDPSVLQIVLERAVNTIFNGSLFEIKVDDGCLTAKKPDFEAINIFGIVIFSIFGALIVLSTGYDVYTENFQKPPVPLFLAFSLLTNGRKLFAISTKTSANSIECLTGMKILSMVWVVFCHNYLFAAPLSMLNGIDFLPWFNAASSMHILMGTLSVDTFLFISGLLVAWLGFRELEKNNGKLKILWMYFHRYIRLTPAVAAVILYIVSIDRYIGSGPYRERYLDNACMTTWWSTLLYIQNYVNPDKICVGQTWYLAVDTQLYILSPLILIPLWKWDRKFAPIMVVLSILSMGCIIATYYKEDYHQFFDLSMGQEPTLSHLIYMPTHTRYTVWLIGVGMGYFMYKNKSTYIRPPKVVYLTGWIISFVILLSVIYGPYFAIKAESATTVLEAAMYQSFKRIGWSIALCWIVFACYFGFGGVVNSFLAHPWWQPLGRLTYSMYLVHMAVQGIHFGSVRTSLYFSSYNMILFFWSTFGISLMAAIVLTLAFESPILVIEKSLLKRNSNSTQIS